MHPASEGDCATLEWGDAGDIRRALVDLGRTKDYKALKPTLVANRDYALFVMTHVDADHIEGAMPLVGADDPSFQPGEVWFNAYHHLIEARDRMPKAFEDFGAKQGEKLSAGILRFGWRDRWNKSFGGRVVSTGSPEAKDAIDVAGLSLRLISPDDGKLAALEPRWLKELKKAKLRPLDPDEEEAPEAGREHFGAPDVEALAAEEYREDTAEPNGSSIAFLADFAGRRVLMPGDAHPDVMVRRLRELGASEAAPMRIDLFKVSHHGSKANTSPELLALVDCRRYAFSTDGTKHDHPDGETVARILKQQEARRKKDAARGDTELIFNFRQPFSGCWDVPALKTTYRYACRFPDAGASGVSIDI
jgi:beta-lactamase superfamily II metal-dependent hydrolase